MERVIMKKSFLSNSITILSRLFTYEICFMILYKRKLEIIKTIKSNKEKPFTSNIKSNVLKMFKPKRKWRKAT